MRKQILGDARLTQVAFLVPVSVKRKATRHALEQHRTLSQLLRHLLARELNPEQAPARD